MSPIIYEVCKVCDGRGWVTIWSYPNSRYTGSSIQPSWNEPCKACNSTGKTDKPIGFFEDSKL